MLAARETSASVVHEVKTLVLSRHPVIAVETAEEDRVRTMLASVGADLRVPVFEWSITRGLVGASGERPVYGTEDPQKLLGNMAGLTVEAIFLLKDFARHLTAPFMIRELRELADRFARPGRLSTVVLCGEGMALPKEIESLALRYELGLPDRDEYRRTIAT
ncbi:MAG: AAA family ATPase, partial [Thermoleophilaceae bacterium]|nr:AAA family ATPase [Thermoleophilaceae bacterium]